MTDDTATIRAKLLESAAQDPKFQEYQRRRRYTFAPGDFTPIAKGGAYPGDDEDTCLRQGTPLLVKVRHRAPGQKHGVVRAFSTISECEQAVASLNALHFITEYMVIDLRDSRATRERVTELLNESDEWSLEKEREFAQQQPPPESVGPFPHRAWIRVFPGVATPAT